MGDVIRLWGLEELEQLAREAVQRAWKTRASVDYDRADKLFAQWNRLRRRNGTEENLKDRREERPK